MSKISIIIPILNEAETILGLIEHLITNSSNKNIVEIIVVDGGSTDGSLEIVSNLLIPSNLQSESCREADNKTLHTKLLKENFTRPEVKFLISSKGRAKQMNLGAKHTKGRILYFLHADSLPPKNFDQLIINEVKKGNSAGCFKMKFDNNHWWLQRAGWLTTFPWRACRGGDQSQFITKKLFIELNGYDENYLVYEDYDLINKLYSRNKFIVIQEWITTSARRYESNGIWKLQYHFWIIYMKKFFGASPEKLYQYYLKNIS